MKVWVRLCVECQSRYGCKYFDEYGDLNTRACNKCLFSCFDKPCFDEGVEVETTHGICDNCFSLIRKEK